MERFSISLSKIIKLHNLKPLCLPENIDDILIYNNEVNRPGLEFVGFLDFFNNQRIQVIGRTELDYLEKLGDDLGESLERYFSCRPVAVIITRSLFPGAVFLEVAQKYGTAVLGTDEGTSNFVAALIADLNIELAPRITRHGVLVEVYGEGILLLGESGVGKSETAMELIKRGHRLIADDAVEIRRVSPKTLIGSSPENIRHFMELRGIGVINVRRIFGIGSVKNTEKIDMVINLEQWDSSKMYDRMGLETEYMEILGNKIPMATVPVKPGRNLAVIIEVAAMNHRQKKMGYNAAQDLLCTLGMIDDKQPEAVRQSTSIDEGFY